MANTSPINVPTTGPVVAPPYLRGKPAAHRSAVKVWIVHTAIANVLAWVAKPIQVRRGHHLAVFAGYTAFAIVTIIAVVGR